MPDKATAIRGYTEPRYYRQAQQFFRLVNVYWFFIHDCAKIINLFTNPLRGPKSKLSFPRATKQAVLSINDAISKIAPLTHFDPSSTIYLMAKASYAAV